MNVTSTGLGLEATPFASGQARSYLRATDAYTCAQLYSAHGGTCVVMGTGNMDEDGYLAYYCKAGDGVCDIQLITELHKSEVFALGKHLGVPESIIGAPPSADLWDGQTDEEEIGASYEFVELYTGHFLPLTAKERGEFLATLDEESLAQFTDLEAKIVVIHNRNKHKIVDGGTVNIKSNLF
jgi:NAD+ synthase (glutamine-hydrolysing)